MFDKDVWIEIFQVLGKNPLRTAATAFGVMWGIMMLVLMMGAGNGLENGVKSNFNRVTNCLFVWTQTTSKPYAGFRQGRSFNLRSSDVDYLRVNIPEIDIISPRNSLGGYRESNNVTRGTLTGVYKIYGDTPDYIRIEPRPIETGRFLNWGDLAENRKVCIIGTRVFKELFAKDEDPIGKYIVIQGVNFMVAGVYRSTLQGEAADEETKNIFIPFTTFQKAFNRGDVVGWLSVTGKENVTAEALEEKILGQLKVRHKIHPDDNRAFGHYNSGESFRQMQMTFDGIRALSWFVGVLTLLAGIIGVSNIMLVIIKERTKEIGVRKALGATPVGIVSQILLESLFLSCIAGFVGVIFGVWLLEGVNMALAGTEGGNFKNPGVNFDVVFAALLILIVGGTLAGLIPAVRAVGISPVEALRDE
ncbi:MAG: ABC transporter permease [Flavobacteriales bacterium]|nr:ABC transporter permease [Flavobacteriales bacterium]